METVFLTESELERSRRIADLRNSKNNQVPNFRETRKHTDYEIHFAGVRSEMAVCKRLNFPIDEHFSFSGDDNAPDLYWYEMRLEVKTATYKPPILKLNQVIDFVSDFIILCYVYKMSDLKHIGIVEIYGGVSRAKFSKYHYIKDFGRGPRACYDTDQLKSLSEIEYIYKQVAA